MKELRETNILTSETQIKYNLFGSFWLLSSTHSKCLVAVFTYEFITKEDCNINYIKSRNRRVPDDDFAVVSPIAF